MFYVNIVNGTLGNVVNHIKYYMSTSFKLSKVDANILKMNLYKKSSEIDDAFNGDFFACQNLLLNR